MICQSKRPSARLGPLGTLPPPEVYLVVPDLTSGGAQRVCATLANAWLARGNHVQILVTCHSGNAGGLLDPAVPVHELGAKRVRGSLFKLARALAQAPRAPVLAFGPDVGAVLVFLRLTNAIRNPVVFREASMPLSKNPNLRQFRYRVLARAQGVIAQTKASLAQLHQLGLGALPFAVIPNPLALAPEAAAREQGSARPRLLAVGRLSDEKGFDDLLRGFEALTRDIPGVNLAVLGEGKKLSSLLALRRKLELDDSVQFPGFKADVSPWYAASDLFILSSRYEGMPNALLEALAAGCRILARDCSASVRELMISLGLGEFLLDLDLFERELPKGVRLALSSPTSLWEEARARVRRMCDLETVQEQYWNFCCQAAQGSVTAARAGRPLDQRSRPKSAGSAPNPVS